MNSDVVRVCPTCGARMEITRFPGGIGPGSATPTLSGPYAICPQCGYGELLPNLQLEIRVPSLDNSLQYRSNEEHETWG